MAQVTMGGAEYAALIKQADHYEELKQVIINAFEVREEYTSVMIKTDLLFLEERTEKILEAVAAKPSMIKRLYEKDYRYLDAKNGTFYNTDYNDTVDILKNANIAFLWRKLEEGTFDGEDEEV